MKNAIAETKSHELRYRLQRKGPLVSSNRWENVAESDGFESLRELLKRDRDHRIEDTKTGLLFYGNEVD